MQPAVFLPRRSRLSCQRIPTATQLWRALKRLRGSAGLQSLPAQHQQNASVSIWQLRWGLFHNRNAQLQCTSERSSSSCKLDKVWQNNSTYHRPRWSGWGRVEEAGMRHQIRRDILLQPSHPERAWNPTPFVITSSPGPSSDASQVSLNSNNHLLLAPTHLFQTTAMGERAARAQGGIMARAAQFPLGRSRTHRAVPPLQSHRRWWTRLKKVGASPTCKSGSWTPIQSRTPTIQDAINRPSRASPSKRPYLWSN